MQHSRLKAIDEPLTDKHVVPLIMQCAEAADPRPELSKAERLALLSGHSLRAGRVSSAEVTRRYQRRSDRFRVNLTKAAGL